MMACTTAALLALILNYLTSSDGALSPPLNLSLEMLDFKALLRWLPGPGNLKGTRYSVEFTDIDYLSRSQWTQARNCTNITSTQCYLFLNQRIHIQYFVRVVAEWKDERSEWTCLPRSFQPYEYTFLSAPNLNVSAERHSILISLSHPVQSLTEERMRFSVDLFQMISKYKAGKHIVRNITTRSSCFVNLPSGNYCINATAFLTASSKRNNNVTKCVFLHLRHTERKLWVVYLCVILLLTIIGVIALIRIYCYVKIINNSCIPDALHIVERTGTVLTLNSEELHIVQLSQRFTEDCVAVHQEADDHSSQDCYGEVMRNEYKFKRFSDGLPQMFDVEDHSMPPDTDPYSTAVKLEDTDEHQIWTKNRPYSLTPKTSYTSESLQSTTYSQNTVMEYTSDVSSCGYSEQTDSSAGETYSLHSNLLLGCYEPRPDPRWMLDTKFRSQH